MPPSWPWAQPISRISRTHIVRPRGRINLFAGFPWGSCQRFDLNAVHYGEHHVTGAFGLTLAQFREALELIASGAVAGRTSSSPTACRSTMRWRPSQLAEQGEALKAVITP